MQYTFDCPLQIVASALSKILSCDYTCAVQAVVLHASMQHCLLEAVYSC